jgi:hypothetical protein
MALTGGVRAEEHGRKICGTVATRDHPAERLDADPAKPAVMTYIGQLVRSGLANWAAMDNGEIELTLLSGEVFHLSEASVTRVG